MSEISLVELKAGEQQKAEELASLARCIWTEHYTPIIGKAQVEYMLDKFQSANQILKDIEDNGYKYFIAYDGAKQVGYCAVRPYHDKGGLFLSKLYVEKSMRGHGISRIMLNKIKSVAKFNGLGYIWLTVNKNNLKSIEIYKKLGFSIVDEMVTDIGNNYVMDDYKMQMNI
jgi:ribosomal protein S18 acetylase RimI-like enzyme